jgi:hypothetical protein
VLGAGGGVEERGFEPESSGGVGTTENGGAVGDKGASDGGHVRVSGVCRPEEDGADGGTGVEGEVGIVLNEVREALSAGADVVDEFTDSAPAEGAERDRDLENVGAACGAQRAAEQVGESGVGVVVGVEVVGVSAQRAEGGGVGDGEQSCGDGLPT